MRATRSSPRTLVDKLSKPQENFQILVTHFWPPDPGGLPPPPRSDVLGYNDALPTPPWSSTGWWTRGGESMTGLKNTDSEYKSWVYIWVNTRGEGRHQEGGQGINIPFTTAAFLLPPQCLRCAPGIGFARVARTTTSPLGPLATAATPPRCVHPPGVWGCHLN